jgi:hypothetical protein
MIAFAEGEVQREINCAKNRGEESAVVDVRVGIDIGMLKEYLEDFGYTVEDSKSCNRRIHIQWSEPTK